MTRAPSTAAAPAALPVLLALLGAAACSPGPVHRWADGRVVARGHVVRHEHEGRWTLFDEQGRRVVTGTYTGGAPTGVWKQLDPATGRLLQQHTFVDGALHGPAAGFHTDGARAWRGAYAAGARDGAWTFWRADGSVDPEQTGWYVAGVRAD
jgi:antitoxin component YwqK of YwqJK toxin-antitoxin module